MNRFFRQRVLFCAATILSAVLLFSGCIGGPESTDPAGENPFPVGFGTLTISLPEPEKPAVEIVPNLNHASKIGKLAVTSGGRFAVTAAGDNSIKIWDLEKGALVRTIHTPAYVKSLLITHDDRRIISCSEDRCIRIRDLATGTLLKEYEDVASGEIVFGRKADELLISVRESDPRFYGVYSFDLEKGTKAVVLDGTDHFCDSFSFSRDRRYAVSSWNPDPDSSSSRDYAVVWDLETGEVIEEYPSRDEEVRNTVLSPDMKYIAASDGDNTMMLWDRTGDEEFPVEETGLHGVISLVRFSPDGEKLLVSADKTVRVFNRLENDDRDKIFLHEYWEMTQKTLEELAGPALFIPEKEELLTAAGNSLVRLDTSWLDIVLSFGGVDVPRGEASFSTGTGTALTYGYNGYTVWDMEEGLKQTSPWFPDNEDWYGYDVFHGPTSTVLTLDRKEIVYWSAETGEILNRLTCGDETLKKPLFNRNGTRAFYIRRNGVVRQVELPSGNVIREYTGEEEGSTRLALSRDESKILTVSAKNEYLQIWDVGTGERIYKGTLFDNPSFITFSPVDDTLFIGMSRFAGFSNPFASGMIYRFDYTNGTDTLASSSDIRVTREYSGHTQSVGYIDFSADGSRMISCSVDKSAVIWDTESGEIIDRISHPAEVERAVYSDDEKWIYTFASDGIIRQYDGETAALVASSFSGPGKESIVWTPDGYFAGQGRAANSALMLSRGMETWGIDQFATFKNRPDIVMKRRGSANTALMEEYFNHYLKRLISNELLPESIPAEEWNQLLTGIRPEEEALLSTVYADGSLRPEFKEQSDIPLSTRYRLLKIPAYLGYIEKERVDELHAPEAAIDEMEVLRQKVTGDGRKASLVQLELSFSDLLYDLRSYNVYINGVPLFGLRGRIIEAGKKNISVIETAELSPGENRIEVSCFNNRMTESFRALRTYTVNSEPEYGDLYFVGFGVSDYSSDDVVDLRYADDDIRDLEELFTSLDGNYDEVHTHVYLNGEVTPGAIRNAKNLIADASPRDTLIVAAAGHGIHNDDPDSTYYFLTADAQLDNLSETAAEFSWIENLLAGETASAPRNRLLLLDTCQSGDFAPWMDTSVLASSAGTRGVHARSIIPLEENGTSRGLARRTPRKIWTIDDGRYILNSLNRSSGAVVFSSCKGDQFSFEDESLENGYFTASFIEVFQESIAGGEEVLDLRDVISRVTERVKGRIPEQTPTVDRDNMYLDFDFPLKHRD